MFLMLMMANEIKTSDRFRFGKVLKLKMLSELLKSIFLAKRFLIIKKCHSIAEFYHQKALLN